MTPTDFYSEPTQTILKERFAAELDELTDVRQVAELVAQLVVYDMVTTEFYGLSLTDERAEEIHLRSVEEMIERLDEAAPVGLHGREPKHRLVGRCHHYTRLAVELLRATGVPARARCGFGAYFNPPRFEDHWICEYWDAGRWRLMDAQFDDEWQRRLNLPFDAIDVPRDQFLVAADAWQACRSGRVDAELFGISFVSLAGLWYVAGNLVRDAAALNRAQMLPWDFWGAQPESDRPLTDEELAFFDRLADLTHDPDSAFDDLRRAYENDDRLTVPATVFNALHDRREPASPDSRRS